MPPIAAQVIERTNQSKRRIEGLDFLKGLAILWVIFEHVLPENVLQKLIHFFPMSAVPVFFSISFYFMFKKYGQQDNYFRFHYQWNRLVTMVKRIFIPFFVVLLVQILILFLTNRFRWFYTSGGYGPGAYYPWVYLQIWFMAPILYWIVNRKKWIGVFFLLGVVIFLNIFLSYTRPVSGIYRLLSIRYLFVAAIAYIWLKKDNYNKLFLLVLGILSLIYLWFFRQLDLTPIIYNGDWSTHNYPAYFFTFVIMVILLAFAKENKDLRIMRFFRWCGENSWYIFLAQMFFIFLAQEFFNINSVVGNSFWRVSLYILIIFTLTLDSVYLWNHINSKVKKHS